jgi:hypothetical protein
MSLLRMAYVYYHTWVVSCVHASLAPGWEHPDPRAGTDSRKDR